MISKTDIIGAVSLVAAATIIGIFSETAAYYFLGAVVLVGVAVYYPKIKAGLRL